MPATTAETLSLVNSSVSVAPLVLLSAADHYGRTNKARSRRVVGVLLGQNDGKHVRVSNCFAGESLNLLPMQDADQPNPPQYPSKKTTKTPQCGSWTTTT